jgi:hypothetical protein
MDFPNMNPSLRTIAMLSENTIWGNLFITNNIHSLSGSVGLLLLCEVAAKPFHEESYANYSADQTCRANKKFSVLHQGSL